MALTTGTSWLPCRDTGDDCRAGMAATGFGAGGCVVSGAASGGLAPRRYTSTARTPTQTTTHPAAIPREMPDATGRAVRFDATGEGGAGGGRPTSTGTLSRGTIEGAATTLVG